MHKTSNRLDFFVLGFGLKVSRTTCTVLRIVAATLPLLSINSAMCPVLCLLTTSAHAA